MGSTIDEAVRLSLAFLRLFEHAKNLRALSTFKIFYILLRYFRWRSISHRDDSEDFSPRPLQRGKSLLFQQVSYIMLNITISNPNDSPLCIEDGAFSIHSW